MIERGALLQKLSRLGPGVRRGGDKVWAALKTRAGASIAGLTLLLLAFVALDYATLPPPLPAYAQVRATWHPSEAWLYDRNGVLI
ncbi:MAG: penicillin-binding protein 1C, partial [Sphingomonas sp.]